MEMFAHFSEIAAEIKRNTFKLFFFFGLGQTTDNDEQRITMSLIVSAWPHGLLPDRMVNSVVHSWIDGQNCTSIVGK
jgi:hypothetical protein